KLVTLRLDRIRLRNGQIALREVVEHPGAVGIVALDDVGRVLLVRQYRHPVARETLEIPAGTLGSGERPEDCARRELRAETGYAAANWRRLLRFSPTAGYGSEWVDLFLATGLSAAEAAPEPDEEIDLVVLPLEQAVERVVTGGIFDGKTMIALLLAERERR